MPASSTRLPEFRRCPFTERMVLLAPERSLRPLPKRSEVLRVDGPGECPFCPGNEHLTTLELDAIPWNHLAMQIPWKVRVVQNKFPAVRSDLHSSWVHSGIPGDGEARPAFGIHEVVVDSPGHVESPVQLEPEQLALVLTSYRNRLQAHASRPELAYSLVFKNVGLDAGASLVHAHSQIVGLPLIPESIRSEFQVAELSYVRAGACLYCQWIQHETLSEQHLVARSPQGRFVTICPSAPRFAYEMWVLPVGHESRYSMVSDEDLADLAVMLHRVLLALDRVLNGASFNYFLHNGPLRAPLWPSYHWHIEIVPRTERLAGFEWGSGCFINPVLPDVAAAQLRANLTLP